MLGTTAPALRATYRIQLHAQFTLRDAQAVVPYLERLGVSHLYASPLLAARKGSRHGYDVVDPRRINSELGTEDDLAALAGALHQRGMGLLLDIVPNHMSAGPENRYWEDVLARGEQSRYARWFDIAWDMHADRRLVLPILGDDLRLVVERGEIAVQVTESGSRLTYFQTSVPLSPETVPEELQLAQLDPAAAAEAQARFSGADNVARLNELLDAQHYRLLSWRQALREINYRRFFDVNDLVAIRVEDPAVFSETHERTLEWVEKGFVDGLRVDHIDGLRDPEGYLRRLRAEVARRRGDLPIVVEKILMRGERLRDSWPVDGTTGYERLNDIGDLLVNPEGFDLVERRYRSLRRQADLTFESTVRADKRAVLDRAFAADVLRLAQLLDRIVAMRGDRFTREQIFHGIEEFVAWFPVYRSYLHADAPIHPDDSQALRMVAEASGGNEDTVCGLIRGIFCDDIAVADAALHREFVDRMQQLTGPAMAKGLEDTAHYAYVPLVSRNEVGGAPDRPLDAVIEHFHEANEHYARYWPRSLVATATHDTKRSGDVRARITAISEHAAEWQRSFARWRRLNRRHRAVVRGRIVPDPNAEWLVYETLVGIWPSPRTGRRADDIPDRAWRSAARGRLEEYVLKAVREAKLRTSWTDPDVEYERGLIAFTDALIAGGEEDPFLADMSRFVSVIAPAATWNTLSRVLLHLTVPGTPDVYQGDEIRNFTLVDPDNRRPVDYDSRRSALDSLSKLPDSFAVEALVQHPNPKLMVIHRLLRCRSQHPGLFSGGYLPVKVTGPVEKHVVAFIRQHGDQTGLVVAPRLTASIAADELSRTLVELPREIHAGEFRCVVTGRRAYLYSGVPVSEFGAVPFGFWVNELSS